MKWFYASQQNPPFVHFTSSKVFSRIMKYALLQLETASLKKSPALMFNQRHNGIPIKSIPLPAGNKMLNGRLVNQHESSILGTHYRINHLYILKNPFVNLVFKQRKQFYLTFLKFQLIHERRGNLTTSSKIMYFRFQSLSQPANEHPWCCFVSHISSPNVTQGLKIRLVLRAPLNRSSSEGPIIIPQDRRHSCTATFWLQVKKHGT